MNNLEYINDPTGSGNETIAVASRRKRKFNIFPWIICFLIALVVWLWMVNLNDTEITENKILKIEYVGLKGSDDGDVMIYDMDKTEISVTVKGSNRDLKKYADSEYRAVVDLSALDADSIEGASKITLPVSVIVPQDSSIKVVESQAFNVSMYVDTYLTRDVQFDVMIDRGSHDTNTYESIIAIDGSINNNNVISITGPSRIVSLISYARYSINSDLLMMTGDAGYKDHEFFGEDDDKFPLKFLDKNYNDISGTEGLIDYSTHNISVKVNVTSYKEIGIRVTVNGKESDKIAHAAPSTIKISGKPSALRDISEYVLDVKTDDVNTNYTYALTPLDKWEELGVRIESVETQVQVTFSDPVGE